MGAITVKDKAAFSVLSKEKLASWVAGGLMAALTAVATFFGGDQSQVSDIAQQGAGLVGTIANHVTECYVAVIGFYAVLMGWFQRARAEKVATTGKA